MWLLGFTCTDGMPSQGFLRVQSSHIMTPRLKISHFSVKGSFRISSGAIHSGVPAEEESLIGPVVSFRESPKSHILITQCLFTRQFALFRSRWTMFIRWMLINPLFTPGTNEPKLARNTRKENETKIQIQWQTCICRKAFWVSFASWASFSAHLHGLSNTVNPSPYIQ